MAEVPTFLSRGAEGIRTPDPSTASPRNPIPSDPALSPAIAETLVPIGFSSRCIPTRSVACSLVSGLIGAVQAPSAIGDGLVASPSSRRRQRRLVGLGDDWECWRGANVIVTMTFMPEKWVLDRIYSLADAQLGYFSTSQAEELGVDRRYLSHHVRSGNLERAGRGVYRFLNYPAHPFEDVIATILWIGDGAVASHDTALAIYGLADAMPAVIHISVPRRFRGSRPGVLIHRAQLPVDDVTVRDGIPVTTPLRTILDAVSDPSVAAAAAEDAIQRGLIRASQLRRVVEERPDLAGIFGRSLSA